MVKILTVEGLYAALDRNKSRRTVARARRRLRHVPHSAASGFRCRFSRKSSQCRGAMEGNPMANVAPLERVETRGLVSRLVEHMSRGAIEVRLRR